MPKPSFPPLRALLGCGLLALLTGCSAGFSAAPRASAKASSVPAEGRLRSAGSVDVGFRGALGGDAGPTADSECPGGVCRPPAAK